MRWRVYGVGAALCVALSGSSSAQAEAPALDQLVRAQDTVRVWSDGRVVLSRATVTGVSADTLWLERTRFARSGITRLDVQSGRHNSGRRTAWGTVLGLVGGATAFAFVGAGLGARSCNTECEEAGNKPLSQGFGAFLLGTAGGVAGGVAGFIIGYQAVPKWKTVLP